MILERFTKQPAEVKDYDVDYAEWLDPKSDSLDTAVAVVTCITDPTDTALVVNTVEVDLKSVKLWVSGGTDKQRYKVTIQALTLGGRLDESELIFSIKDF